MTDAEAADPKALYEKAKQELQQALLKKRTVDRSLVSLIFFFQLPFSCLCRVSHVCGFQAAIESNLYAFEGSYLSETASSGGNIIQGFEGYLKGTGGSRKKQEVNLENDRIFSNSSTTCLKVSHSELSYVTSLLFHIEGLINYVVIGVIFF
jgi:chromatin modification-related protein EAF6